MQAERKQATRQAERKRAGREEAVWQGRSRQAQRK